jgi:hypothetical protein
MSKRHAIDEAVAHGDYKRATRLVFQEIQQTSTRLSASAGVVEKEAGAAIGNALLQLLSACGEPPSGQLAPKLIYLAMELGHAQAAVTHVETGAVEKLARVDVRAESLSDKMRERNADTGAWHLPAFVAYEAALASSPNDERAALAAAEKFTQERGLQYRGDPAFRKAHGRKRPDVARIRAAVMAALSGSTPDVPDELREMVGAALAMFSLSVAVPARHQ